MAIETVYCYPSALANLALSGDQVWLSTQPGAPPENEPLALKADDSQVIRCYLDAGENSSLLLCTSLLNEDTDQAVVIPAGSALTNMTVWVRRKAEVAGTASISVISPVYDGGVVATGTNEYGDDAAWPADWEDRVFKDTDVDRAWGIPLTLAITDLNDSSFGIGISVTQGAGGANNVYLGQVRIMLQYYALEGGGAPFRRTRHGFAGRGYGR